jgi:hypothetical protein
VALRHAQAHGIPAQFIDLEFAEQSHDEDRKDDGEARSLLDERHFRKSRYLGALASELGCRDHEELWEHLFEVPCVGRSLTEYMTDMAAYCHLARVECSDQELLADSTLRREAEMVRHIREALSARSPGDGPVLAVVGGFHAVVIHALLDSHVSSQAAAKKASTRSIDDAASVLIRYGFDRLDRLNGYASGMTSPAWHQHLWERMLKHDKAGVDLSTRVRRETALKFLFDFAHELRETHGLALPMPTLAGAYEHVLRLAALRQRPAPVRDDVFDAVVSCFIKGDADADGALVLAVAQRTLSGRAMGQIPPGVDRPPLVRDFDARARRQKLKIDDSQPRRAVLDIYRREDHRVTSRLFHGLTLLGIPLAYRTAGPDFVNGIGLARLQEHWQYSYSAATEAALVEASVYGTTVPFAVANRFDARLERFETGSDPRSAQGAALLLIQACVLGLHDHLPRMAATLSRAVGEDAAFESVAMAATTLGLLWESREPLDARAVGELLPLLRVTYERAIYLGGDMQGVASDGAEFVIGLTQLRELLASEAGRSMDATLYWTLVTALKGEHASPLVRGAATGLLYCAARLSDTEIGRAVDGHLNGLMPARNAVAFLRGLLQTAREAAWQEHTLLSVLDRLLHQWDNAEFIAALPDLRLAFAEMTPKETDRIAQAVATLHGREDLGSLVRHDRTADEVQANLVLSQKLIAQLKADGLGHWVHA